MKKFLLLAIIGLLSYGYAAAQKLSYNESVEQIKRGTYYFNKGSYQLAEEFLIKGLEGVEGEYKIMEIYALGKLADTQKKLGKQKEYIENNNKAVVLRDQVKAKIDERIEEISENLKEN